MSELQELTVKELITKMYNTQHQLQRNTAYAVGDIATSPDLPSWAYLECIQAGTTSSTPPQQFLPNTKTILSDGSVQWRVRDIRCRYEVGDLVPKLTTPKSYEYLILCDGSTFDASEYPLLADVFPDGVLPDLSGRVLEGDSVAKKFKDAGLPDIQGRFEPTYTEGAARIASEGVSGCFSEDSHWGSYVQGVTMVLGNDGDYRTSGIQFKASSYNSTYGKSSTVQMASFTVKYYVCYGG